MDIRCCPAATSFDLTLKFVFHASDKFAGEQYVLRSISDTLAFPSLDEDYLQWFAKEAARCKTMETVVLRKVPR